jgi:hypothetical protein
MATYTFNTTAGQDARIGPAFGKYLGLPGNASAAQVKAEVIAFIRLKVLEYEKIAAVQTATDAAIAALTDFTPPT